jgi:hypothetical protein
MINKNLTLALGILALSTSIVSADQGAKMNQSSKMNPPQAMPMGVTSQPTGVITPPVAPTVNHGADFFVEADFIYWYTQQSGLDYVTSSGLGDDSSRFLVLSDKLTENGSQASNLESVLSLNMTVGIFLLTGHG